MDPHDLPLGFGMALAQNEPAMKRFESFSEEKKKAIVERTHNIKSKTEMRALIDSIADLSHQLF